MYFIDKRKSLYLFVEYDFLFVIEILIYFVLYFGMFGWNLKYGVRKLIYVNYKWIGFFKYFKY